MTDSKIIPGETEKKVLLYLKSQQVFSSNVDVSVTSSDKTGKILIRKGQVVFAECGKLVGNGALLTLAAIAVAEITTQPSITPAESNVSLSLALVERLLSKLPALAKAKNDCNEDVCLQQAIHLIHQFRKAEAGAKLVEVLRSNRFYYHAWLWHSRLMTREDYIKKALSEARKWGNRDLAIQRETEKLEHQLHDSQETVKRCIFCWSIIAANELRCKTCQGVLRIPDAGTIPKRSSSSDLAAAIEAYERELQMHPDNTRIVYCLCLGHYSLGNIDRSKEFVHKALQLSPNEPIFNNALALLNKIASPVGTAAPVMSAGSTNKPTVVPQVSATQKTILVVEDSQTSRKVISMLLGRKGYTIIEAQNGSEALQKSEELIPNLVLLDVMLPDMTGYEVLSRLRQSKRLAEVPVIMLTGKSNPSDKLKGLFHGSNEYLTKPFDPAKLLAVLEKHLEHPSSPPGVGIGLPAAAKRAESRVLPTTQPMPTGRSIKPAPAVIKKSEPATPAAPKPLATPLVLDKQFAPVAAPSPIAPLASVTKGEKTGKTILVIEDSPTSRKVITMVLAKKGYGIEEAATGGDALRKLDAALPNLILLDAMLPDMTGYDILHRLKNDARMKEVPVVMLTAKNNPMDRQKGLKSGSVAYLTKPFDPEKLLAVIHDNI